MMDGMGNVEVNEDALRELRALGVSAAQFAEVAPAAAQVFAEAVRTTMSDAVRPLQEASGPALAAAMEAMRDAGQELKR